MRAEVYVDGGSLPVWITLLTAAIPTLLVGAGWSVKQMAGYKDRIQKPLLDELEEQREEGRRMAQELTAREHELTVVEMREMFHRERSQLLQEEINRLRKETR